MTVASASAPAGLIAAAVATALIAGDLTRITASQGSELARLTVAVEHLPKGCRLAPILRPDASGRPRTDYPPLGPNPWLGNRLASMASIRHAVEGRPDSDLQGPALHEQLQKNLVAAYKANYVADDGGTVTIWAVQYDDPKLAMRPLIMTLEGQVERFVFGASAARITWSFGRTMKNAPVEACYKALREHVSALK